MDGGNRVYGGVGALELLSMLIICDVVCFLLMGQKLPRMGLRRQGRRLCGQSTRRSPHRVGVSRCL